ncbi:MAG: hypothetical protein AUK47_05625 [Deltaproteobacteria bacterium CG2_30_63_29]|nr:MAG: hypothetical protein AUK47_05625 [Deltaproteobacteria bacterium CG2_30_63_29]PJB39480.1 MAG: hypothetical protein CO108_17180 [Deltaproteobacteria bacterium CG_4_9_14_3_um_filter_63_12]
MAITPQPIKGGVRWGRETRVRVVGLCGLSFLLMLSYSLARPATESLFLEAQGADALPQVWLLVALASLAVVALYNRVLPGRDLAALFGGTSVLSAGLLALLLSLASARVPLVETALYVWKDVYMVVLVEIFYSFSNSVFPIAQARWLYGLFGFIGALGGVLGNLGIGALSLHLGTLTSLWVVLIPLLGMAAGGYFLSRVAGRRSFADQGRQGLLEAFKGVSKSQYLLLMIFLVAVVQLAVTLIDLQFNSFVQLAFVDRDERTSKIAFVYAAISTCTLVLHALTGPILRFGRVPKTLLLVPLLILGAGVSFALAPGLVTIALLKIASKTFDYTVFRTSKEMLYIPLDDVQRTQGKSIVDMLTYRVAKGGASLLLLSLAAVRTLELVNGLIIGAVLLWTALTVLIVRQFRARVSREAEHAALGRTAVR